MIRDLCKRVGVPTALVMSALALTTPAFAQSSATIHGQVSDPSGAAVTNATIQLSSTSGQTQTATSKRQGLYEFKDLAPGRYRIQANAPGFAPFVSENLQLAAGQSQKLDIALEIQVEEQKVQVTGEAEKLDVSPSSNANSLVLRGKDLEALSDDPDDLQADLEALAGPSAGPNGGQIYIDGFTAGQLPPKSAIREIRINQNPFSSDYDKLGYGRIEIFTKPGTDTLHGQLFVNGNTSALNSLSPLLNSEPPSYNSRMFSGTIGGPLSKKASFSLSAQRRDINNDAVVSAIVLDPSYQHQTSFDTAVSNPRTRTNVGPRLDYQLGANNTLTLRYQYWHNTEQNDNVGQLSLPSQATNSAETEHTVQISDTQIFGSKIVNETRFQFLEENNKQTPASNLPAISVLGSFLAGGNSTGHVLDHTDHYELQNYTSLSRGAHLFKFGARVRGITDQNTSTSGFNGTFTFSSLAAYQQAQQAISAQPPQPIPAAALPSQFLMTTPASYTGGPLTPIQVRASMVDAGLYAQDDWRWRPNITLSYGLRFETQTAIHDHGDWAPRVALAWGIGRGKNTPGTVVRAGWGMFYDRFGENLIFQAKRLNGQILKQYVVAAPNTSFYPNLPGNPSALPVESTTVYQVDPRLRAPYTMQSAVTIERQISKAGKLAVSYLNSRGIHQLLTRNINAPNPALSFTRPLPGGNIYEYESRGVFKQNQLIVNLTMRAGAKMSLWGYYTLNYANSDTSGANSFPSDQYNLKQDYGRASFDARHRAFMGGTVALPWAFRLSPFVVVSSGSPFNIVLGQDFNGDSIFNDRPSLISSQTCSLNLPNRPAGCTPWGTFSFGQPVPGHITPINYGTGPAQFAFNMHLSKTFGMGAKTERPSGGGGPSGEHHDHGGRFGQVTGGPMGLGSATDRRYSLTLGIFVRNLFNNINWGAPIGNLDSPLFGRSDSLMGGPFSSGAANRQLNLQATFSF